MSNLIAIGDIHGMSHLLDDLLELLPPAVELIFLGDYIDRGPDSRGVIARLISLQEERHCIFLRGNHEVMALDACYGDDESADLWYLNGGIETLGNYPERIYETHLNFLQSTVLYYQTDDYIFVHAGLVPGIPLPDNPLLALVWIREPFLNSSYNWGKLVVHGHTPVVSPELYPNRLNIDTGAVYGRTLTAVLLPEMEFISV